MLLTRPAPRPHRGQTCAAATGGDAAPRPVPRRAALALTAAVLAATTATPLPAFARNATAAAEAAAARKAALKAAIENAKATGKDAGEPEAFQSAASVPEDHSPNSHSHQEEGAKTAGGG